MSNNLDGKKHIGIFHHLSLILIVMMLTACSAARKVEYTLECVLQSVHSDVTGKTMDVTRKVAMDNGYSYAFKVFDDGRMLVNDTDVYRQDQNNSLSYTLHIGGKAIKGMKFVFTENYDDVRFELTERYETYHYDCNAKKK